MPSLQSGAHCQALCRCLQRYRECLRGHTAYYGSVLRYPAPIVLGMLEDQGWDININLLLASPTNLSADTLDGDVLLGWDAPLTDYIVQGYQVCREGVNIGSTDTASYLDLDLPAGSYYYTIEAIYSMGTSEPSNGYSVEIPVASSDPYLSPSPIELSLYPNPSSSAPTVSIFRSKQPSRSAWPYLISRAGNWANACSISISPACINWAASQS